MPTCEGTWSGGMRRGGKRGFHAVWMAVGISTEALMFKVNEMSVEGICTLGTSTGRLGRRMRVPLCPKRDCGN